MKEPFPFPIMIASSEVSDDCWCDVKDDPRHGVETGEIHPGFLRKIFPRLGSLGQFDSINDESVCS